jgi:hypothetical protein
MTSTDLMNVQAFANKLPAKAFQTVPATESLADGIGSSYGVIGYKGKVWTLRHRDETHTVVRPDDQSPAAFLDVIILRSAPVKAKSYYPEGSFEIEGSAGKRPTCAAIDGITPDADVEVRQATACAICPRNVWRNDANGRKGRECSDYKRLAVLLLPTVSKALLGAPLMEPVFLRVPPASLNDLALFGEAMQNKGFPFFSFITRIGFQPDKAHPQMTFRALQELTDAEAPVVLPMREEPMAYRITGEDQIGKPRAATTAQPQVQQTVVQPQVQPQVAAVQQPVQQPQPQAQQPVATGFVTIDHEPMVQAKPQVQQPQPQADQPVSTGFGEVQTGFADAGKVAPQVGQVGAVQMGQTNVDTGEPEASDADLDARVKALLG